jgi:hypothetical protein
MPENLSQASVSSCPRHPRAAVTASAAPHRAAGFSLVELLVSSLILVLVVLGLLAIFDFSNRVARSQTQIAGMQQVQRVAQDEMVRLVRMAGRGGLVIGAALQIRNDVPAGEPILVGSSDSSTPIVREASDVVSVRGIFNSQIYQLEAGGSAFTYDGSNNAGTIVIRNLSPSGVPQPLDDLEQLLQDGGDNIPEALLLVSRVDDTNYVVVEVDPTSKSIVEDTSVTPPTKVITLRYVTNGDRASEYQALSSSVLGTPQMQTVAYVGILEEYRYYVREVASTGVGSATAPELARARVYPGSEDAYRDDPSNLKLTVAENVLDLQVALGRDDDSDGVIEEGATDADRKSDEWRFNVASDNTPAGAFSLVRLTTLVRTAEPEPYYEAPRLADVEDRTYEGTELNESSVERRYRRWPLQTFVDLRNL